MVKLGETKIYDFVTHDPETGDAKNASSSPAIKVYGGTNSTEMVSTTATLRGSLTGNYYTTISYSTTLGYGLGHNYNIIVEASVAGGVSGTVVTRKETLDSVYLEERLRIVGLVDTAVGATSTGFATDLEAFSTRVDAFTNCLLLFTGGLNVGQVQKIASYDGTGFVVMEHGFAVAPSTDDTFIVVNI